MLQEEKFSHIPMTPNPSADSVKRLSPELAATIALKYYAQLLEHFKFEEIIGLDKNQGATFEGVDIRDLLEQLVALNKLEHTLAKDGVSGYLLKKAN